MEHRSSECTGDRIKVESNAEVAVHGEFVEDSGIAIVELEDRLVPESMTGDDGSSVDHDQARVIFVSQEQLARIS